MSPFKAKGDVPKWQMVYNVLALAKPGDIITYDDLDAALEEDFRSNRHPLGRAVKELLEHDSRTVEVVRGEGYRIVEAREHERLARGRQKRARRQLSAGLRTARGTDRSSLTVDELMRLDRLEANIADQMEAMRRHESRIAKLEEVAKSGAKQKSSDDEQRDQRVERLYEALARAGIDTEDL